MWTRQETRRMREHRFDTELTVREAVHYEINGPAMDPTVKKFDLRVYLRDGFIVSATMYESTPERKGAGFWAAQEEVDRARSG